MLPLKSAYVPNVSRFFEDDWNSLFDWTNRNLSNQITSLPAVNVAENPEEFVVELAAPGLKKEDFKIEINNNSLVIKSDLEIEKPIENDNSYSRKEFEYHSFQRSFNLNTDIVDHEQIKATYEAGILSVTLPKKEEAKPKPVRTIQIT
jgi:HSP20 family protein